MHSLGVSGELCIRVLTVWYLALLCQRQLLSASCQLHRTLHVFNIYVVEFEVEAGAFFILELLQNIWLFIDNSRAQYLAKLSRYPLYKLHSHE